MKAFIFGYSTNYDLGASIVYAETQEEAIKMAKKSNYIWDTSNCYEINFPKNPKVITIRENDFVEDPLNK